MDLVTREEKLSGVQSKRTIPCKQWFLQAGRYATRPGETTACRVTGPYLSYEKEIFSLCSHTP